MKEKKAQYLVIAEAIQEDIKSRKYKEGERLPTERELQDRFEVSRMTVRHALAELEKIKAVRLVRNRGAFVMNIEVTRSKEIVGLKELMERRGIDAHSKVIKLEKGLPPNDEVKNALELEDGEEVYYLYRVRYAKDEVIAIEYAHVNAKMCPGLEMFNFEKFSLYDVFFEHYKMPMAWAKDDIRADIIRGEEAKMLVNEKSAPSLIVYNTSYNESNVPIEYTKQIYNYKIFTYTVISSEVSSKYRKN